MTDEQRPPGFEDFTPAEYAWFEKHWTGRPESPVRVEVPFPVRGEVLVQQQFEWKTALIRIGSAATIRMWTEDVIPYLTMLIEIAERSIRIAGEDAERKKKEETHVGYDEG